MRLLYLDYYYILSLLLLLSLLSLLSLLTLLTLLSLLLLLTLLSLLCKNGEGLNSLFLSLELPKRKQPKGLFAKRLVENSHFN